MYCGLFLERPGKLSGPVFAGAFEKQAPGLLLTTGATIFSVSVLIVNVVHELWTVALIIRPIGLILDCSQPLHFSTHAKERANKVIASPKAREVGAG